MKNDGNSPPVNKNPKNSFTWETGKGVDKTKITRAHEGVVYMAARKPEQRPEVAAIIRSKVFREIKNDLKKQLQDNDTVGKFYDDLVNDYMSMYVTKILLTEDIQKRGVIVPYNNGGGQSGVKKNESIEMFNKTNAQMLKLLSELGLKAKPSLGGDYNDEL